MAQGREIHLRQRVVADSAQVSRAAIILAAGASSRMGQPKALLSYQGETFLDRLSGIFERHCETVIAVLGHHAEAIRAGARRQALFTVNPVPERGMLSSLQCGLRALPAGVDSFFFTPVDYPAIHESTVARLAATDAIIAVPRYEGRRGHPVLCKAQLAAEFLATPTRASDVIHAHAGETVYVDVADPGIVADIDEPADYERLVRG